ncbi:Yip1 family protein [Candidatus Zixiibacteriota bacterium]
MNIISRVINIATKPKNEWPVIAAESATVQSIFTGFIMPLAAIGPVCGFIQSLMFTSALGFRPPVGLLFVSMIVGYLLTLAGVFILAFIVDKLAPTFQSSGGMVQALKLVAYAQGPVWVAGVLGLIPFLGILTIFVGLYCLYIIYLGFTPVMNTPPEKVVPYLVVVIIVAIIVWVVIGLITASIVTVGALTGSI